MWFTIIVISLSPHVEEKRSCKITIGSPNCKRRRVWDNSKLTQNYFSDSVFKCRDVLTSIHLNSDRAEFLKETRNMSLLNYVVVWVAWVRGYVGQKNEKKKKKNAWVKIKIAWIKLKFAWVKSKIAWVKNISLYN